MKCQEDTPKVRAALRLCEKLGVLDRIMVPYSVLLDGESPRQIVPPRLFFLPRVGLVAHSVGDDPFYAMHPEYVVGGVSKEIYILDKCPLFLSNYFAMEDIYSKFSGLRVVDAVKEATHAG